MNVNVFRLGLGEHPSSSPTHQKAELQHPQGTGSLPFPAPPSVTRIFISDKINSHHNLNHPQTTADHLLQTPQCQSYTRSTASTILRTQLRQDGVQRCRGRNES